MPGAKELAEEEERLEGRAALPEVAEKKAVMVASTGEPCASTGYSIHLW